MNKHFVKVVQTYATKNKLQEAVYRALKEADHTLLEKKHLPTFITEMKDKLKSLNAEFPRCKPQELRSYKIDDGTAIYVEGVIIIHIYNVLINS